MVTAYDPPRDPIGDLQAACARITAAHQRWVPVPLEFPVPALAGHDVHRAGLDVAVDDQAAFQSHALTMPPAGWMSGWVARPDTILTVWRGDPQVMVGRKPAVSGVLTELPVWPTGHAPVGALVPVHVRRTREGSP